MNREVALLVAMFLIPISLAGLVFNLYQSEDVVITAAQIQTRINAVLPIVRNDLSINSLRLELQPGRVGLVVDAEGKKFGTPFSISAKAVGNLEFRAEDGEFYFRPEAIDCRDIKIKGKDISEGVSGFIDRHVHWKKVLDYKKQIADKVEFETYNLIQSGTIWALGKIAIHKLPETLKKHLHNGPVQSMEVTSDAIVIHISFVRPTKMVVASGILLFISLFICGVYVLSPKVPENNKVMTAEGGKDAKV